MQHPACHARKCYFSTRFDSRGILIDEGLQNEFVRLRFNQLPKKDIIVFLNNISKKQKKYEMAIKSIQRAIEIAVESESLFISMNCYYNLSELYEEVGDHKQSLDAFKQHIAIKERIQSDDTKRQAILFDQKRALEEFFVSRFDWKFNPSDFVFHRWKAFDFSLIRYVKRLYALIYLNSGDFIV